MQERRYIRANALPVSVRCPACSELRTIEFEHSDLDDPVFAEIYKTQPLTIPCEECQQVMAAAANEHALWLYDACVTEQPWAIRYIRRLIQKY